MNSLTSSRIKLSEIDDVVSVVPYLLGFEPEESLVVLVVIENRVGITARMDIAQVLESGLTSLKYRLAKYYSGAEYILLSYSHDEEAALECLSRGAEDLGSEKVIDQILVTNGRYLSIRCEDPNCCPPEGKKYPPATTASAAEAVSAGLVKLPDRSALAAQIRPPTGEALSKAQAYIEQSPVWLAEIPDKRSRVSKLVNAESLDPEELIELGILIHDVSARNKALFMLDRVNCHRLLSRWCSVVRAVPAELSVPALCLAAISAWLCGDGALMMICYEQAKAIDPQYLMLGLIYEIYLEVAPPTLWDQLNPITSSYN